MTWQSRLLLLALTALPAACAAEDPGITPSKDGFYFPTGLAMVQALHDMLFVTNANADLMYNGGTINVLDLSYLPDDLEKVAAQVKAKKLDCQVNRVDPTSWECTESQFIDPDASLRTGDFPNEIRINSKGTKLFVPVRGQDYLLWAEIVVLEDGGLDLRCNRDPESGCGLAGKRDCSVWDCDSEHRVAYSNDIRANLPSEPFGIYLNETQEVHLDSGGMRRTCTDGRSPPVSPGCKAICTAARRCRSDLDRDCCYDRPRLESEPVDHLYVAHLAGGEISYFTVSETAVKLRDIQGGFFTSSSSLKGGFSISSTTPGDPESTIYASSRVDSVLAGFVIRANRYIVDVSRTLVGIISPATDARGIAYHSASDRLFVVDRKPTSLVAMDMSLKDGRPRQEALWAVEVCPEPSLLRLATDPTRTWDPEALLVYVVCFGSNQIFVVDAGLGQVVDQIPTGRGPYSLEMDPEHRRAYVTNFLENTVGVIDLDPSHAGFDRVALRIGLTTDLVRH